MPAGPVTTNRAPAGTVHGAVAGALADADAGTMDTLPVAPGSTSSATTRPGPGPSGGSAARDAPADTVGGEVATKQRGTAPGRETPSRVHQALAPLRGQPCGTRGPSRGRQNIADAPLASARLTGRGGRRRRLHQMNGAAASPSQTVPACFAAGMSRINR